MEPLEIVRLLTQRLNDGDLEGMFELYHEDVVNYPGEHWPEGAPAEGIERFRETTEEWLGSWESIRIETDRVEAHGDRVVAHGAWHTTGRISGVSGALPVHLVFTVRDGRIARVEWFPDDARADQAARGG
jgi:ketosteroid isomerase-like protein